MAQFRALETYWYLRLQLGTREIPRLYERLYPKRKDRLAAMGISAQLFEEADYDFDNLIERVLNLVKQHPGNIEGIWFTGGLTDPNKTELYAGYLGEDGRWHRYTRIS